MELLDILGDGAIVELDFQSENYQKSLDAAIGKGLQMLGMDGLPLKDRGRIIDGIIDPNSDGPLPDEYIAYFPYELTGGTAVEIYERNDGDLESILDQRDRMWSWSKLNQPINQNQPKTRYLTVLVDDIEKVRSFYKDHILLNDIGDIVEWNGHKLSTINARGVYDEKIYLRIVEPVVNDQVMNIFKQKGSGHIMEIGVEVSIRVIEWASFVNRFIKTGDFDVVVLGWSLSLDPDQYNIWHSSQQGPGQFNFLGYSNKNVDKLLEVGRKELNLLKREKIYHEFSKYLLEDSPIVYLYAGYSLSAIHKRVKGIKQPSPPAGIYHNNYDWFIPKPLRRNEIME